MGRGGRRPRCSTSSRWLPDASFVFLQRTRVLALRRPPRRLAGLAGPRACPLRVTRALIVAVCARCSRPPGPLRAVLAGSSIPTNPAAPSAASGARVVEVARTPGEFAWWASPSRPTGVVRARARSLRRPLRPLKAGPCRPRPAIPTGTIVTSGPEPNKRRGNRVLRLSEEPAIAAASRRRTGAPRSGTEPIRRRVNRCCD